MATAPAVGDDGHNGVMTYGQAPDNTELFDEKFWDDRYRTAQRIWSGNPNAHLVEQVADLAPGTALDIGCGEGADAVWLASRGWQVAGVDISSVALDRAAEQVAANAPELADRIKWQRADVLNSDLAPEQFDLVSAQFLHVPEPARDALHRRLAAAVRPGGTLLIVGHHVSDLHTAIARPRRPDLLFTAEDLAAMLDPELWDIETSTPAREAPNHDGKLVTIHDAVLRAVRKQP